MKLNKKIVITIIVLIVASLSGLVYLQVYLLKRAIQLETQTFHQNVTAALTSIVQKLETQETLARLIKITIDDKNGSPKIAMLNLTDADSLNINEQFFCVDNVLNDPKIKIDSNKVTFRVSNKQHVCMRILDSLGQEIAKPVDEIKEAGEYEINLDMARNSNRKIYLNFVADSTTALINIGDMTGTPASPSPNQKIVKRRLVEKVIDDFAMNQPEPIMNRINPAILDSIVQVTLSEKGVQLPYAYGIVQTEKDSVIMVKPEQFRNDIVTSQYRTVLFPHDIFVEKNEIVLYFPDQKFILSRQFGFLVLTSLIFVLLIIFSFFYVLKAIFKQKKLSTLLVDFINNMTHEFKTPISTISLASETLRNPIVLGDEKKLNKYGDIIYNESARMRNQVEKILQMAALESEDVEFHLQKVDIHKLITNAVINFTLVIEKRKGSLTTKLNATSYFVEGDVVHLANIVHNLLDNAIKYTKRKPEIVITTENVDQHIVISIRDNGIGLKPEEQKKVFEKYYRVPTGNVHDVKGFGLGLSYVELIAKKHGGRTGLKSKPGKGSEFFIYLPCCLM